MSSFNSTRRRTRGQFGSLKRSLFGGGGFVAEGLERRVLLSSTVLKFSAEQSLAAGNGPRDVITADVNGDGNIDLIAANHYGNSVSVLLGNGNGTFQTQQTFATGAHPNSLAAADVNGDGRIDVVVANNGSNTVSVLLGNGNGTFQAQATFAAVGPYSVAVADFNGDGKPDITFAIGAGNVGVLLGNGNGSFQAAQTFASGVLSYFVSTADVNGDGKADLIISSKGSHAVSVLLGNGNGAFQAAKTFDAGSKPYAAVVADINGDGKPDIIVPNNVKGVNTVSVLLGNGDGTFQPRLTFATGNGPSGVAVADFNGDGAPDLAVSNSYDASVGVLLGNGNGTFQAQQVFPVATGPDALATADLNGDGQIDLVVVQSLTNLGALLNRTNPPPPPPAVLSINRSKPQEPGTVDSTVQYTVTFSQSVSGIDPTDFAVPTTGSVTSTTLSVTPVSGSVYTVTVGGVSGSGTLGLNLVDNGSIHNQFGQTLVGGPIIFGGPHDTAAKQSVASITTADVNSDGFPDAVYSGASVGVLLGLGNGTFQSPSTFAPTGSPRSIVSADVNGDGKPDIVVVNPSANSLSVLLGNGNATFQTQKTFATIANPYAVAVSDVNGDGRPDLVVASGTANVGVLLGNGNGTFQAQQTFSSEKSGSVAVADVNGDGRPDILILYSGKTFPSYGNVGLLLGNGDGTFQAEQTFLAGVSPEGLVVADVNGDGIADVAVANVTFFNSSSYGGTVGVFLGNGNGTFQAQRTSSLFGFGVSLSAGDLNGDGKMDLIAVATTSNSQVVEVLQGNGDGTFSFSLQNGELSDYPGRITCAAISDINGDGRPDIVAGDEYQDVAVFLNNTNGNFTGQVYTVSPPAETITVSSGNATVMLNADGDGTDIDWSLTTSGGSSNGQLPINDAHGLTINGAGGIVTVNLVYIPANPLPNALHLNGTFLINELQGSNPLAATTLEIGRSTVLISYSTSDPLSQIKTYLKNGYNTGGWNGAPTASTGVITSLPAAQNANQTTAIGYADSADGLIANQSINTIELKYTLYGDTGLSGSVGFNDFTRLTQHYNQTTGGTWDTGDFNYDGSVNFSDFTLMTRTYNTGLGSQTAPAVSGAAQGAASASSAAVASNAGTTPPAVQVKPSTPAGVHRAVKHHRKHRVK